MRGMAFAQSMKREVRKVSGFVDSAATRVSVGAKAYAYQKLQMVKAMYESADEAILEMPDNDAVDNGRSADEEEEGAMNQQNGSDADSDGDV
eukprot:scaffold274581_cov57-Attheya_sp.AAC.2